MVKQSHIFIYTCRFIHPVVKGINLFLDLLLAITSLIDDQKLFSCLNNASWLGAQASQINQKQVQK